MKFAISAFSAMLESTEILGVGMYEIASRCDGDLLTDCLVPCGKCLPLPHPVEYADVQTKINIETNRKTCFWAMRFDIFMENTKLHENSCFFTLNY
jgi:hypothetical protein